MFDRVARHGVAIAISQGFCFLACCSPNSFRVRRKFVSIAGRSLFTSPNTVEVCFSHAPARDGGIAFLLGCFDGIGEAGLYQEAPTKEGGLVDSDDKSRDKTPKSEG